MPYSQIHGLGFKTTTNSYSIEPVALGLNVGELVGVRPLEEILATLDNKGQLGGLPFMPEMLSFWWTTIPRLETGGYYLFSRRHLATVR